MPGTSFQQPIRWLVCGLLLLCCACWELVRAEDKPAAPRRIKHQITGLFSPDREQDLRDLVATMPRFKLVEIDYKAAEATFEYDPAKVWPGEKPGRHVELLDNELRNASKSTFGVKPLRQLPLDKLKRIEISVEGLDCKGCAFAAYLMVYQLPGVELATVSFKTGKVSALINPEKTDRVKLEAALKKGGVAIKTASK